MPWTVLNIKNQEALLSEGAVCDLHTYGQSHERFALIVEYSLHFVSSADDDISLLMSLLLGHRSSLWIAHKENDCKYRRDQLIPIMVW
jgi:hypothetical protein